MKLLRLIARLGQCDSVTPAARKTEKDLSNAQRQCVVFLQIREDIDDVFARIEKLASNNDQIDPQMRQNQTLGNFTCYEQAVDLFSEQCYRLSEVSYFHHFVAIGPFSEITII